MGSDDHGGHRLQKNQPLQSALEIQSRPDTTNAFEATERPSKRWADRESWLGPLENDSPGIRYAPCRHGPDCVWCALERRLPTEGDPSESPRGIQFPSRRIDFAISLQVCSRSTRRVPPNPARLHGGVPNTIERTRAQGSLPLRREYLILHRFAIVCHFEPGTSAN